MERPHPVPGPLGQAERDWVGAERLQWACIAVDRNRAADALTTPAPDLTAAQRNLVRTLGVSVHELGEILREQLDAGCVEHYREAIKLDARIGDRLAESIAAYNLGGAYMAIPELRDLDEAERFCQRSLDLVGEQDMIHRARILGQLGYLALERHDDARKAGEPNEVLAGHLSEAARLYEEALRLRSPDDVVGRAVMHSALGNVYHWTGEVRRAFDHYQRAIRYHTECGNRFSAGQVRFNVALMFAPDEPPSGALLYARAALADFESYGAGAEQDAADTRALIVRLEQG